MNITLQILLKVANNPLTGVESAFRYKIGDIIDGFKTEKYAALQPDGTYAMQSQMGNPVFAYIHVLNVPDTFNLEKIRHAITSSVEITEEPIRRRKWHIPPAILPTAFKQKVLTDREATINFSTAKAYIRKKTTPVVLDASQDDISTSLTDGDLN